jgi:hypothetical protein
MSARKVGEKEVPFSSFSAFSMYINIGCEHQYKRHQGEYMKKLYGALILEVKKTGMKTGRCVTSVDGAEAIAWVQAEAKKLCLTEIRFCRNLLNSVIAQKMAK